MNKMADWPSWLSQWGYTQICVARGKVSWGIKDNAAGELQLWYRERDNNYCFCPSKTAGDERAVCKVIDVSRYPAAGNCFQKKRYPAVRNFDQFTRNSSFNSSKNIRYLFRNVKRL